MTAASASPSTDAKKRRRRNKKVDESSMDAEEKERRRVQKELRVRGGTEPSLKYGLALIGGAANQLQRLVLVRVAGACHILYPTLNYSIFI